MKKKRTIAKKRRKIARLRASVDEEKLPLDLVPQWSKYYKPLKKPVTLRLDADVLAWFKKQGNLEPDFVRVEIRPFVINSTLSSESGRRLGDLLDHYYYRIECIPAAFDSMFVVVLMDGTVLEPARIANLPPQEIK